jgi:hypothetical protein
VHAPRRKLKEERKFATAGLSGEKKKKKMTRGAYSRSAREGTTQEERG